MMKLISIISIPVIDQAASKEFYLKLGFKLIVENDLGKGQKWVQLGIEGAQTSITLVTWFDNMPPGCINGLVIDCEDLDAEIKTLTEKGIEVGTIDKTPWGRFAAIKDPDGNRLSLHQR